MYVSISARNINVHEVKNNYNVWITLRVMLQDFQDLKQCFLSNNAKYIHNVQNPTGNVYISHDIATQFERLTSISVLSTPARNSINATNRAPHRFTKITDLSDFTCLEIKSFIQIIASFTDSSEFTCSEIILLTHYFPKLFRNHDHRFWFWFCKTTAGKGRLDH